MYLRLAAIAVVLAVLCAPSTSEVIHPISERVSSPFLDGLSADAKKEFWDFEKEDKLTVKQLRKKQLEWAQKKGIKSKLEEFFKKYEKDGKKVDKERYAILRKLPRLYKKYMSIAKDSKTLADILKERQALLSKHKTEFTVIRRLMRLVK